MEKIYSCLFAVQRSYSTNGSWSSVVARRPNMPTISPRDVQIIGEDGDIGPGVEARDKASG